MGFSFVSWIVMMSIFVLSVRFFSSCIFVVFSVDVYLYYCYGFLGIYLLLGFVVVN